MSDQEWGFNHAELVMMCDFAAQSGYEAKDIAYIVEKPWKYGDLLQAAKKALEEAI